MERLKETEPDIAKTQDGEPGHHFLGQPGGVQRTEQYQKHKKIVTGDLNKWRTDRRCVKSVFSIIPDDLRVRQNAKKESRLQAFSRIRRFPCDPKPEEDSVARPEGGGSVGRIRAARRNSEIVPGP